MTTSILRATAVFLCLVSPTLAAAAPAPAAAAGADASSDERAVPTRHAVGDVVAGRVTVFRAGVGGYHTYRIPAAVTTPRGTVLAFAEGRKNGGGDSGDIDLLIKRSTDGGQTFSRDATIIWDDSDNTCGNPCVVVDRATGTIWLLMTHNLGRDHEKQITAGTAKGTRTVWVTSSTDDGLTWAAPREITREVKKPEWAWYATGPGVGIQLTRGPKKGRLVIPCDYVVKGGGSGNAHVIYSDDHGQTWTLGGEAPKREFNESQVVELSDGRLMLNMRNHAPAVKRGAPKHRGVAISPDGGETFTALSRDPKLIEPICQASVARFGEVLVFSNPASTDVRAGLRLRVSRDDGQTWWHNPPVYAGPAAYSCLAPVDENTLGLLFECGEAKPYERIDFVRVEKRALNPIVDP